MSEFAATKAVPLTCHGHSRPITHFNFSSSISDQNIYYLVSASKDNQPQLRNGISGDWIGSFLGHKGAVFAAKVSDNGSMAVTGSADFSAKVWDATTGEALHTINHEHIVRAVAFNPGPTPGMVATGGYEKKLRVWDLKESSAAESRSTTSTANPRCYEMGAGVHGGAIKSIVWHPESDLIVSAGDDKVVRWWDTRAPNPVSTFQIDGEFGSLELSTGMRDTTLAVASGKKTYFFGPTGRLLKSHTLSQELSSVCINREEGKFVVGSRNDTWVRIYDYESGEEQAICKGHHGPVWTTAFSPDGKLFATGSEDGTIKLWKFTSEPYGMWKAGNGSVETGSATTTEA